MGPFMLQNTVDMIFFTDCCTRNFFYWRVDSFLLHEMFFQLGFVAVNTFFVIYMCVCVCFSIHIPYSPVNFNMISSCHPPKI